MFRTHKKKVHTQRKREKNRIEKPTKGWKYMESFGLDLYAYLFICWCCCWLTFRSLQINVVIRTIFVCWFNTRNWVKSHRLLFIHEKCLHCSNARIPNALIDGARWRRETNNKYIWMENAWPSSHADDNLFKHISQSASKWNSSNDREGDWDRADTVVSIQQLQLNIWMGVFGLRLMCYLSINWLSHQNFGEVQKVNEIGFLVRNDARWFKWMTGAHCFTVWTRCVREYLIAVAAESNEWDSKYFKQLLPFYPNNIE